MYFIIKVTGCVFSSICIFIFVVGIYIEDGFQYMEGRIMIKIGCVQISGKLCKVNTEVTSAS